MTILHRMTPHSIIMVVILTMHVMQMSYTPARRCHVHLRASVIYTCVQVSYTPARRCYGLKFVYFSETCLLASWKDKRSVQKYLDDC